jgi:hypothetical protein
MHLRGFVTRFRVARWTMTTSTRLSILSSRRLASFDRETLATGEGPDQSVRDAGSYGGTRARVRRWCQLASFR